MQPMLAFTSACVCVLFSVRFGLNCYLPTIESAVLLLDDVLCLPHKIYSTPKGNCIRFYVRSVLSCVWPTLASYTSFCICKESSRFCFFFCFFVLSFTFPKNKQSPTISYTITGAGNKFQYESHIQCTRTILWANCALHWFLCL